LLGSRDSYLHNFSDQNSRYFSTYFIYILANYGNLVDLGYMEMLSIFK
jgi:hypothetical protein